jgi:hypothetical protein
LDPEPFELAAEELLAALPDFAEDDPDSEVVDASSLGADDVLDEDDEPDSAASEESDAALDDSFSLDSLAVFVRYIVALFPDELNDESNPDGTPLTLTS